MYIHFVMAFPPSYTSNIATFLILRLTEPPLLTLQTAIKAIGNNYICSSGITIKDCCISFRPSTSKYMAMYVLLKGLWAKDHYMKHTSFYKHNIIYYQKTKGCLVWSQISFANSAFNLGWVKLHVLLKQVYSVSTFAPFSCSIHFAHICTSQFLT